MRNAKDMKVMGSYGTIGLEIVLSILLGGYIGYKLDEWLGTKPYMTIAWFFFGCAAAGRSLYRSWKQMQAAAKKEEAEEGNPAQAFPDDKSVKWQREERAAERDAEKGAGAEDSLEKGAESANKTASEDAGENGATR